MGSAEAKWQPPPLIQKPSGCVSLFSLLRHIECLGSDFLTVSWVFWTFSDGPRRLSFLQKHCPEPGLAPGLDFCRGTVKNVPPAFSVAVGEDAACCAAQCPLSNGSCDKFCFEFNARDMFMPPEKLAFCSGGENTISLWLHFGLSCQEPQS